MKDTDDPPSLLTTSHPSIEDDSIQIIIESHSSPDTASTIQPAVSFETATSESPTRVNQQSPVKEHQHSQSASQAGSKPTISTNVMSPTKNKGRWVSQLVHASPTTTPFTVKLLNDASSSDSENQHRRYKSMATLPTSGKTKAVDFASTLKPIDTKHPKYKESGPPSSSYSMRSDPSPEMSASKRSLAELKGQLKGLLTNDTLRSRKLRTDTYDSALFITRAKNQDWSKLQLFCYTHSLLTYYSPLYIYI